MRDSIVDILTSEDYFKNFGEDIRIPCPVHKFMLKKVKHCQTCKRYSGLQKILTSHDELNTANVSKMTRIVCTGPVARRTQHIPEDD